MHRNKLHLNNIIMYALEFKPFFLFKVSVPNNVDRVQYVCVDKCQH